MRLLFLLVALLVQPSLCQRHRPVRKIESHYRQERVQNPYRRTDEGGSEKETKDNFSENFSGDEQGGGEGEEDYSFWQDDKTSTAISTIFKRTKPRGLIHGAWKASQSTTIGFLVGMTCLVTFPSTSLILAGFSIKPLMLSAILGSLTGLGAVGFGIWNSLHHCYWGIMQTPKSIQSWWTGSVWNPDDGNWEIYDLLRHKQNLLQQHQQQYLDGNDYDPGNYYQLLEIPVSASKSEIKRAYHQKAKKWHPDKNPDVDKAEMFLQLHAAYLTLSDDSKRTIYDEVGEQGAAIPVDPRVFFSILYDSFSLKPYTGELAVSTWASKFVNLGIFANGNDDDPQRNFQKLIQLVADIQRKDQQRQVDIAFHLRQSIEPYTSGQISETAFREWCHNHALFLTEQGMFDDHQMLSALGQALESSAHHFRGIQRPFGWPRGVFLWTRKSLGTLSNKLQFYRGIFWIVKFLFRYMEVFKKDGLGTTSGWIQDNEILPVILKLLWSYNMLDVQSTVDGSCWKLFQDSGVSRQERSSRARAVEILGEEFLKVAKGIETLAAETSNEKRLLMNDPLVRVEIALAMAQDKVSQSSCTMERCLLAVC